MPFCSPLLDVMLDEKAKPVLFPLHPIYTFFIALVTVQLQVLFLNSCCPCVKLCLFNT